MADRRGILVPLIILTFIFLSPDPARGPAGPIQWRETFRDVIAEEQHSLEVLQNSSYIPQRFDGKTVYALNLTGLEADRGYAWNSLSSVQDRAKQRLEHALGPWSAQALELGQHEYGGPPLYGNVTGFVHGKWVRSKLEANITAPDLNLTQYTPDGPFGPLPPQPFDRNITGADGAVRLNFHERDPHRLPLLEDIANNVTDIDVELSISDSSTLEEHELRLYGVYFPSVGQAVLTTTSDKFGGIFMLPHLTLSQQMFDNAQSLLNQTIDRVIQRQLHGQVLEFNPWTSHLGGTESAFFPPQCELIVYLQQLQPQGLPPTPAPSSPSALLRFLENELRFPTGAVLPNPPALRFSMLAFSPDCGYVLESQGPPDYASQVGDHLVGSKVEMIWSNGRHHLLLFTCALGVQLILLIRQMREASTPSTRSKVSFYTIAMLSLGDGFTTMTFLLMSIFVHGLWVNLIGTAFLSFISVSFFGMRLLMDIWAVQAPERMRRERERMEEDRQRRERVLQAVRDFREMRAQAAQLRSQAQALGTQVSSEGNAGQHPTPLPSSGTAPITQQSGQEVPSLSSRGENVADPTQPSTTSLPPTAGAQQPVDTGATPTIVESDQDGLYAAEDFGTINPQELITGSNVPSFGSLYTRFYLLLLGTLFLSLNAASWPTPYRRFFFTTVAIAYLSFWLPQIHRNVQRNCRRALNWEFVLGQSAMRLVPFAYFYGYAHNVLFAETDFASLALLALWVWVQVVLLVSQEIIGPRWFIRNDWAPPAYDYHPVLREDEEGATMPIGFSQATATSPTSAPGSRRGSTAAKDSKGRPGMRLFDCAICMQDLEVPFVGADGAGDASLGAGLLARRTYMVTPCRHIFHSACLEGWMKFRLQCPICRETLPPL